MTGAALLLRGGRALVAAHENVTPDRPPPLLELVRDALPQGFDLALQRVQLLGQHLCIADTLLEFGSQLGDRPVEVRWFHHAQERCKDRTNRQLNRYFFSSERSMSAIFRRSSSSCLATSRAAADCSLTLASRRSSCFFRSSLLDDGIAKTGTAGRCATVATNGARVQQLYRGESASDSARP
jgi:hypothetical protein